MIEAGVMALLNGDWLGHGLVCIKIIRYGTTDETIRRRQVPAAKSLVFIGEWEVGNIRNDYQFVDPLMESSNGF